MKDKAENPNNDKSKRAKSGSQRQGDKLTVQDSSSLSHSVRYKLGNKQCGRMAGYQQW